MNRPPRLLFVVTEDWYFCSHRLGLARAALAAGYEVHVLTRAGEKQEIIANAGIILHAIDIPRSISSPWSEMQLINTLRRFYRRIAPDIVHHVALKPVVAGSIAARLAGVPAVINAYTGLGHLFISTGRAARIFRNLVVPMLALLLRAPRYHSIIQNQDDQALLYASGLALPERTTLIPGSGVDTDLCNPAAEPASAMPVVMVVSRLLRDKGIAEFLEAVRILRTRNVKARFVLVGDVDPGNPTSFNRQDVQGWIDEGLVEWWGHRDDMPAVYAAANIVCLPSYREGMPKVLLEASACGRAIVTTDVPGCRDVVEDGVTGVLIPVRDAPRLAEAIAELLANPARRVAMGHAGRLRTLQQFSQERINQLTLSLYDRLRAG